MSADEYASTEEVVAALQALTDEEHQKLKLIARYWLKRRRRLVVQGVEATDLLADAVTRTLEGERRWKSPKVGLVRHLDWVMRSASGHENKKGDGVVSTELFEALTDATEQSQLQPSSGLEAQVAARAEIERIERLFAGDPVALRVLRCRAEGKAASEIRGELKLSEKEYETVAKRILRKFVKYGIMAGDDHEK